MLLQDKLLLALFVPSATLEKPVLKGPFQMQLAACPEEEA